MSPAVSGVMGSSMVVSGALNYCTSTHIIYGFESAAVKVLYHGRFFYLPVAVIKSYTRQGKIIRFCVG